MRSTGSLSVDHEYLALEDGPPIFRQDVTCPALLIGSLVPHDRFRIRGCHPLWQAFPDLSAVARAIRAWAAAISLAATFAISVDFFSWSYLDVSVRSVRLTHLCIQYVILTKVSGFPHSDICGSMPLLRPSSPVIAKASTTYT